MNDTKTPLLGLDYLMPEQAQKHVTVNDALRRLDGLVQLSVKTRKQSAPPETPQNGDRYLIAAPASGAWQNHDGAVALYEDSGWAFAAPQPGWRLWDEAEEALLVLTSTGWQPVQGETAPPLFQTVQSVFEPTKNLGSLKIPSHIILLGVTARVLETITGPESWRLGTDAGPDRFGSNLGLDQDTNIIGPADPPRPYWYQEFIVISPVGGAFTGGRIAVAVHFIQLPPPALS